MVASVKVKRSPTSSSVLARIEIPPEEEAIVRSGDFTGEEPLWPFAAPKTFDFLCDMNLAQHTAPEETLRPPLLPCVKKRVSPEQPTTVVRAQRYRYGNASRSGDLSRLRGSLK
ncbi:hypothetical protein THAOC_18796 [Thalassiosira oceanica]|uniref:Uncharacterized protein n=1 Tax=Thalassiosira oceanica TaxID=159749 RepID=K0S6C9_THAOC|nr:hypothetical protein THAOC_18796 [Thalassiosira oceanica]|eukprot:EJK60795.1 hypothetical protein THAOC_18796 [Thalassiosira oceanica]